MHIVHCALYIVHCTMHIVQGTMHNAHCTLCIVCCTLYNVHCALYVVPCTMYIVHCMLYLVQCTLCIVQCSFHIAKCTRTSTLSNVYVITRDKRVIEIDYLLKFSTGCSNMYKYCTRPISKHQFSGIFKDRLDTKHKIFKKRMNS